MTLHPHATRTPRSRVALLALAALGGILWTTGCAEERDPIDRTQPYALEKSFFVGEDYSSAHDDPEFWSQNTLTDVGYGAAQSGLFTSTYAQPMSRVKWQITEDFLIARLAYERLDASDGKGTGGPTQDGVIVAAFRIESHFDIINSYNPTTGEKLNIIEENAMDRPWFERDYIRVDWSQSHNVNSYDFDTLSLVGIYGGITYEPLAYFVEDPKDPDAPYFDMDGGYFDITTKAFARPNTIDLSHLGWGIDSFPACYLDNDFMGGSAPTGSCSPVELTLRHSFRRVVDNDYEPKDWDGFRFQAFGAFTVERMGYTRNYGMTDDQWHRFIARYPIWERSHYYDDPATMTGPVECFTPTTTPFGADPNRDTDGDGTADECQTVADITGFNGSTCDTFKQKCTLPYQARTVNPIPWYYADGSNPEYWEPTDWATHEWDVAMRTAVRSAQNAECKVSRDAATCNAEFPMYFGQQTDNVDAVRLAREVDACRHGLAYPERAGSCETIADDLGALRGYSAGVIAIAKMPEMIVQCHSPVMADDPAACGGPRLPAGVSAWDCHDLREEGTLGDPAREALWETCQDALHVRRGDLRYHQLVVVTEPQTPSPWGIYTDAEDPLTGETVSASINVWSHVNDLWSQGVIDVMRFIAGELDASEITEGEYIDRATAGLQAANGGSALAKLKREDVQRRLESFAVESAGMRASAEAHAEAHAHAHAAMQVEPPAQIVAHAKQLRTELKHVQAGLGAASVMKPIYAQRRETVAGSDLEAQLMNKAMQELHGVEGLALTDGLMDMVSPLRGGNPTLRTELEHMKQHALAEQGTCVLHEAPAPLSISSLSKVLQEKFGAFDPTQNEAQQITRAERMRRYLARMAHYAVVVHEMGHSIGLRHNFVSSSDAWGYRPQYWQLRTKNGQVTQLCDELQADGEGCVGPRYFDPLTEEEKDGLIWMWMHSSVMDYAGELAQDTLGLGAYDFAAARMFYGDVVSVHADPSYSATAGNGRALGLASKMDNFGGILGLQHQIGDETIHYSDLHNQYELIQDCQPVDPADFQPPWWDADVMGEWHPTLDGLLVAVDGVYQRCRQQPVDYVDYDSLGTNGPTPGFLRGTALYDTQGRVRVPYGFASDNWADLGNLSVYRHDNGADAYELFDFLITQQEVGHIFDNYRRGRNTFSVRSASGRQLGRYNAKMRDGAKGLGLLKNIYKQFAVEQGFDFANYWPFLSQFLFSDNILASSLAFDHFTRQTARPQAGDHYLTPERDVALSSQDTIGNPGATAVVVPNGGWGTSDPQWSGTGSPYEFLQIGGRPVENGLSDDYGDYDAQYTINAGSYYEKIYSAMLMTESVDNFISSSRSDFVDARYRAVSLADLFPEGYRRWLGNMLTSDESIKGPAIAANAAQLPLLDGATSYPIHGIGWTSWWGEQPAHCFAADGTNACRQFGDDGSGSPWEDVGPDVAATIALDSQVGWEVQKFLIAWTMMYLPENQQQTWLDMLRVWELGRDADPGFGNRIELHLPTGKSYVAKTFGKETVFGKTVQRGIAARVLEWANALVEAAYDTEPGPDLDGDGQPDWVFPRFNATTGLPLVKYDNTLASIDDEGFIQNNGVPGCDANDNSQCTCSANRACLELQDYVSMPYFLRQTMDAFGFPMPQQKGVWD